MVGVTLAWTDEAGLNDAVRAALVASHRAIWAHSFDPRLFELVRVRIAQLLRCEAEIRARTPEAQLAGFDESLVSALPSWPSSDRFDERDRVVLGWVEQWVLDVKGISDDDAARVKELFTEAELAQLTLALASFEAAIRARAALEA
jgi:alkylhydroperoxidase family enzyme